MRKESFDHAITSIRDVANDLAKERNDVLKANAEVLRRAVDLALEVYKQAETDVRRQRRMLTAAREEAGI